MRTIVLVVGFVLLGGAVLEVALALEALAMARDYAELRLRRQADVNADLAWDLLRLASVHAPLGVLCLAAGAVLQRLHQHGRAGGEPQPHGAAERG